MGNIFRDNAPIPAATGIQIDRKRLQELQRKRIALGHKPDDHELEPQGYTMQFHWFCKCKRWHKACIFCVAMDKEAFQKQ